MENKWLSKTLEIFRMLWLVILLYAIFTSSFPISKVLVKYAPPLFIASARTLIAGVILLSYCLLHHRKQSERRCSLEIPHTWLFVQLVFFCIFINYIARFWAMNYLPSSKACLIFSIDPVLSLFFSYLVFGETNTRKQWLGFLFGFLSLIPVLLTSTHSEAPFGEFLYISWPELLMLISVIANSYRWVLMRKLVRDHNYSTLFVNGVSLTLGGLISLATSWFVEGFFPVQSPLIFFSWMLLAILVSNVICASLYGHLLRTYTATFLSLAGFMSPLFGVLYGWLFFGESMVWLYFLATAFMAISMYLFYSDETNTAKIK